ncbi:MAG: sugar isomerase domain-containing protein [Erysipelotrichales bacterium]|nr:MAG: sugar isomerase domain-containing protein [Erysipelotrichales bacterium]
MLKERFYQEIDILFDKIRISQKTAIEVAAAQVADHIEAGHNVYLFDTGHIIDSEIYNRAGGLVLMRRFTFDIQVNDNARRSAAKGEEHNHAMSGYTSAILQLSNMEAGDVLFIGSVSGKTINVIDLAIEAKKRGIFVIALTSVVYSSQLASMHASGLRLFEAADLTIDNCAPYADAMMEVNGLDSPFIPASGIAAAYIMWALNAEIVENLLKKGIQPGVLRSVNVEENRAYNSELQKRYIEKGY